MTPHYAFEVAKRMAEAQDKARGGFSIRNHIEDMQWYEGYANNGEKPAKGVVTGNWNNVDEYDRATQTRRVVSNIPERLSAIFEKMGVQIEWSDMVSRCDDCGLLVETTPSHAWWKPEYVIVNDCELLCLACAEPKDKMDPFTKAYVECALWSSTDESDDAGGEPLDKNYNVDDIDSEALNAMIADCVRFQKENADSLECVYTRKYDAHSAGHDFWLNRNGHGAGFWDGDIPEPYAERLSKASKGFGECNLYVGDDGSIYVS